MLSKLFSWLGALLWLLSLASLVIAWWAVYKRGLVLGLEPLAWYWNALVIGVLALGAEMFGKKVLPPSGM